MINLAHYQFPNVNFLLISSALSTFLRRYIRFWRAKIDIYDPLCQYHKNFSKKTLYDITLSQNDGLQ